MAPPRKHETDAILDAARALVLTEGPRAAGVAAIAKASGAPVGTLYHRFGNRDGILKATWLRGIERFQRRAMAADGATPVDVAVAMAGAVLQFARDEPEDARLLLTIRRADLLDGGPDADFDATLADMNAPVFERLHELARGIFARDDDRAMDAVMRAVADLPYATVRRHIDDGKWPVWLSEDLATSVRRLLSVDKIVSASREIAAPSDVIFELIADPAQQPRWDGNENLLRMASGGRVRGVGEVFTMEIKQGGFRDNLVIEFEEGRRIAWRPAVAGEQPLGHLWRWELQPAGEGRTLVTHTYDWTQLTDEKRFPKASATTADKLQESVDRLAAIVEG